MAHGLPPTMVRRHLCSPLPQHKVQSCFLGYTGLGFPLLMLCQDPSLHGLLLLPWALADPEHSCQGTELPSS